MEGSKNKQMAVFFGIALFVVAISQVGSYWVDQKIPIGKTYILNSFIYFTHVRNFGGIFGSYQGSGWIFATFTTVILSGVAIYLWRSKHINPLEYVFFGFIVGGGASNVIDRLVYGSVIDFINVQHIPKWNYVFNTADTMIHVGIWPLIILGFMGKMKENP